MDESHRLKPMVENYDPKLFQFLYTNTKKLREKLAWDIDARKYGVDYNEIVSWFDVKFIFAFNKYYNDERCKEDREQKLKAFIINALQMYKRKIVIDSYKGKQSLNQNIEIGDVYAYSDLVIEEVDGDNDLIVEIKQYFKNRLSEEAYFLFELELNPPPYILAKFDAKKGISKLTVELITEYLEIPNNDVYRDYIKDLHREIKEVKQQAKDYYSLIKG